MRRCILCRHERSDQAFSHGNPVCRKCVHQLEDQYSVEFSLPQRVTRLQGFIKLLGAIRAQAVEDKALEDWEAYWLETSEMKAVWMLLREAGFSRKIGGEMSEIGVVYM